MRVEGAQRQRYGSLDLVERGKKKDVQKVFLQLSPTHEDTLSVSEAGVLFETARIPACFSAAASVASEKIH